MLFNSLDFAIFLPIVFILYWFLVRGNTRRQNLLILIASYVFYGWWDWRFLVLILFSTGVDYGVGLGLASVTGAARRKLMLITSIAVNIGLLGFFKYYGFFLENLAGAFALFGVEIGASSLKIVLPVGISFYTFQTLSYSIDVYRRKLAPTRDFIAFAAFVSFFPQLVAGPIERATNLLPQFAEPRRFDYRAATDGLRQILWGLFKKIVIADGCAIYADRVFGDPTAAAGSTLVFGAVFFAIQIYCDFSGYSDIAIGTARLFGFDIMKNFAFPYFSRDIAEFWRRWHISLSTWFRDYVYIPLGGNRGRTWRRIRNVVIIFAVSGFWHGANWTFVVWGLLNALYFMPAMLRGTNRTNLDVVASGRRLPSLGEASAMLGTFLLTLVAWVFFRAESVSDAISYLAGICSRTLYAPPADLPMRLLGLVGLSLVVEWAGRMNAHALANLGLNWPRPVRWGLYYVIILVTIGMAGKPNEFIYFQF